MRPDKAEILHGIFQFPDPFHSFRGIETGKPPETVWVPIHDIRHHLVGEMPGIGRSQRTHFVGREKRHSIPARSIFSIIRSMGIPGSIP